MSMLHENQATGTVGRVLHAAAFYDFVVGLSLFGKGRAFREKVLKLAAVTPGESILDIGCGTGTLAIFAKKQLGGTSSVYGIDPSPEMISRATAKARRARAGVTFTQGVAESLPFPDQHFDAVLSTVMLHHLPRATRMQALREVYRVLKPQGRFVAVDFERSHRRRHGHVKQVELVDDIGGTGLRVEASGGFGMLDMYYVVSKRPA